MTTHFIIALAIIAAYTGLVWVLIKVTERKP